MRAFVVVHHAIHQRVVICRGEILRTDLAHIRLCEYRHVSGLPAARSLDGFRVTQSQLIAVHPEIDIEPTCLPGVRVIENEICPFSPPQRIVQSRFADQATAAVKNEAARPLLIDTAISRGEDTQTAFRTRVEVGRDLTPDASQRHIVMAYDQRGALSLFLLVQCPEIPHRRMPAFIDETDLHGPALTAVLIVDRKIRIAGIADPQRALRRLEYPVCIRSVVGPAYQDLAGFQVVVVHE